MAARLTDIDRRRGLRKERVEGSHQWSDGAFRNPTGFGPSLDGASLPVLGEFFFRRGHRVPPGPLPIERPHETWARRPDSGFRATWLGHSTVLLEIDGRVLLTDPVFGKRASPLSFAGPKRFHPVPARLSELPALDLVLLSHDHYDHLCAETITELAKMRVPIVTALGVGAHLERLGVDPHLVHELDWGEAIEVGGLQLSAVPCQHFSGRGLGDRNQTLWASWVIAGQRRKLFFSGDTGLTPQYLEIGRQHGPFDLVMLEIGAYHPAWGTIHLGPDNALIAHEMLGGGTLMPVHWGTFNLAMHDWDEPARTLVSAAAAAGVRVVTPRLGAPVEPESIEGPDPWWREIVAAPRCRMRRARLATT